MQPRDERHHTLLVVARIFWGKARGIRQQKCMMETEGVNEADVAEWVKQQVLSFSGMTAEDWETWGQPMTNAVIVSSTSLARRPPCPPCVLVLRVLHFQQGPSLIVGAPAGRRRRSPSAFFYGWRLLAFLSSSGRRSCVHGDLDYDGERQW